MRRFRLVGGHCVEVVIVCDWQVILCPRNGVASEDINAERLVHVYFRFILFQVFIRVVGKGARTLSRVLVQVNAEVKTLPRISYCMVYGTAARP